MCSTHDLLACREYVESPRALLPKYLYCVSLGSGGGPRVTLRRQPHSLLPGAVFSFGWLEKPDVHRSGYHEVVSLAAECGAVTETLDLRKALGPVVARSRPDMPSHCSAVWVSFRTIEK